jgi:hypothetical protein
VHGRAQVEGGGGLDAGDAERCSPLAPTEENTQRPEEAGAALWPYEEIIVDALASLRFSSDSVTGRSVG